jgi:hypothetical protein
MKVAQARAINVSEHGMALELPATETPTPVIWFQWDKYKIRGSGAVRHRCRVGRRVVVGLEFNAGLRLLVEEELSEPLLSA